MGEKSEETRAFIRWNAGELGMIGALIVATTLLLYLITDDVVQLREEMEMRPRSSGSGTSIPQSEFNLEGCIVPMKTLLSGGPRKDGIPALTNPSRITIEEADMLLHPDDRVIGVEFGGESVAYPLRILNWHECVNDVVGERPIAVTYCPLCDSAFVFDRRVGGELREFGISGLLLNSNVLLYDRQSEDGLSSLWSQAGMRAVCGPAAEASLELELVRSELTTWAEWSASQPDTKALSFDTGHLRGYSDNPYKGYLTSTALMFPVEDLYPSVDSDIAITDKEKILVVFSGGIGKVFPFSLLEKSADEKGVVRDALGQDVVEIRFDESSDTARVLSRPQEDAVMGTAYSFWFAWRSLQGNFEVFSP